MLTAKISQISFDTVLTGSTSFWLSTYETKMDDTLIIRINKLSLCLRITKYILLRQSNISVWWYINGNKEFYKAAFTQHDLSVVQIQTCKKPQ